MAERMNKLTAPKKKKRVKALRHAPFPIPILSITEDYVNNGKSYYFRGDLIGSSVIVTQPGDMHYLYHMGFFGKGNLSRSGVSYEGHIPTVSNPKGNPLRVIKRQSYIKHLNWQKQRQSQESGNEVFNEMKEYDSEEERYFHGGSWEQGAGCSQNQDYDYGLEEGTWNNEENVCDDERFTNYDKNVTSNTKGFGCDRVPEKQNMKSNTEMDWDAQEADSDFWALDCAQNKDQATPGQNKLQNNEIKSELRDAKSKNLDDWSSQEADTNFWSTGPAIIADNEIKPLPVKEKERSYVKANDFVSPDQNFWPENKTDRCKVGSHKLCNQMTQIAGKSTSRIGQIESCNSEKNYGKCCNDDSVEKCKNSAQSSGNLCKSEKAFSQSENLQGSGTAQLNKNNQSEENHESAKNLNQPMKSLDPLCELHDQDGDVLLVSDSEDENLANQKADVSWKRVIKHDPYKMHEHLQLSLSEAFFLSYGLGCFVCNIQNKTAMNVTEMWRTFSGLEKSFLPNYIAYHYFRSKGWVPKSGLKFGVDFILYKEGPPFYHASFSVVVRLVDSVSLRDDPESITRSLNWTSLSGLNRITENVAKELIMCFVVKPSGLSDDELLSPACIKQFKVKKILVKRWIPAQERETKNEDKS